MQVRHAIAVLIVVLLGLQGTAGAYELETHRMLTESAVAGSNLASGGSLQAILRIDDVDVTNELNESSKADNLVARGAVLEDGADESLGEMSRVLNHFFDPLHAIPLMAFLDPNVGTYIFLPFGGVPVPLGYTSPSWALGTVPFDVSLPLFVHDFSLSEARDFLYDALTASDLESRRNAFGRAFSNLGHVVHHIQDMGQPQHVRNDPHAGAYAYGMAGAASLYEAYVEATHPSFIAIASGPELPTARSYWTTPEHLGMADYTNRNFISEGTNFDGTPFEILPKASYPLPDGIGASITALEWQDCVGSAVEIPSTYAPNEPFPDDILYFIGTPILNGNSVVDFNERTSTYSLWDSDLIGHQASPIFSNNHFNFYEASTRLLPRTASYSAGLIDRFLRGMWRNDEPTLRVLAVTDAEGQHGLRVTNDTPDTLQAGGAIELWYDRRSDGQRVQLGSSSVLASDLEPGQSVVVDLPLNQLFSDTQLDGQVVVVFRGAMADEDNGIAARVCNCAAGPMASSSNADSDCQSLCPCQYLAFQQGDPGTPDGVAITPGLGRSRVQWWDGVGEDANFLGFVDRPIMLLAYPPVTEPNPLRLDAARFANGLTVTLFVKPVAGQPAPESLASIFVSFVQPSTTCACGNFGFVVDTALSFGFNGQGGIPAHYSDSSGYTTVNEKTGTFVSISPALMAECQCAVPTAPFGGLSFSYRSGARSPCASNCDDWTRVDADAVMLCAGELAYPQ